MTVTLHLDTAGRREAVRDALLTAQHRLTIELALEHLTQRQRMVLQDRWDELTLLLKDLDADQPDDPAVEVDDEEELEMDEGLLGERPPL